MKSRDLSVHDLFFKLQIEWVEYKVRSLTYKNPYNLKYKEVCDGKRIKIDAMSSKNNTLSIFEDEMSRKMILNRFFRQWGLPRFSYKNKQCKDMMCGYDKLYYFAKNSAVEVLVDGKIIKAIVVFNDVVNEVVKVRLNNNKTICVDYNRTRRQIDVI